MTKGTVIFIFFYFRTLNSITKLVCAIFIYILYVLLILRLNEVKLMIFVKLRRFQNRKESVLTAMKDLLTRID